MSAQGFKMIGQEETMERFTHKYVFYFYPHFIDGREYKGFFKFFGRVKDGKELAKKLGRNYDYQKLF